MTVRILTFIICAFLLLSCGESKNQNIEDATTTTVESSEPKTILALGDSITAGYSLPLEDSYPSQLEVLLQENSYNYELINAGVSGDTSSQALKRLDLYIADDQDIPDLAIVVIGGNDGLRGQSTDELKENLTEIVTRLQNAGVTVVIGGMQIPPNRGLRYFNAFKAVYKDVANETDAERIPFFLKDVATKGIYNLPDMIHPNKDGYAIIAQNTFDFLEKNKLIQQND